MKKAPLFKKGWFLDHSKVIGYLQQIHVIGQMMSKGDDLTDLIFLPLVSDKIDIATPASWSYY